ncbi:endonuclease I family protein [Paenibacillus sp. Soil724D2]|uniref:endonuclease I family protein n=1 Tax=Paenibacillus sp. (strain Soil724D2) TaxID=1736392 RepID=UPI000713E247|nr:endonuclease [Paenibacillus sp. Soil724D2]KRE48041.1 endonuclease I [Paenibacillus sp. Soil724D2]
MMNSLELLTAEREKAIADYLAYSVNRVYYDEQKDKEIQHIYYLNSSFERDGISHLLEKTHQNKLFYSPYRYVYPWVDIHENKKLKSIYSGRGMDPLVAIEEDIQMLKNTVSGNITSLSAENMLNCEHVVPQSWFDKQEPMRGDLHHLFACEPTCNSRRGNHPYYDFLDYVPESRALGITEGCGKLEEGKFEPEYGKGIVARATMYFITRYPNIINRNYVDLQLLIEWHQQFPVSLYEKHRNLAIYELQGNRNPFIDFPHLGEIFK